MRWVIIDLALLSLKKVDKRAVARNTLKRKMIESIRVLPKKERGYDMVFYMKKSAIEISQAELEVTLSSLTAKLE
jgi:ribonuclease P protein component